MQRANEMMLAVVILQQETPATLAGYVDLYTAHKEQRVRSKSESEVDFQTINEFVLTSSMHAAPLPSTMTRPSTNKTAQDG
jgi:hypothetical protein